MLVYIIYIYYLYCIFISIKEKYNQFSNYINLFFFSVIKIPAKNSDQPSFDVTAIVDPVSRGAQKLGPILSVLHETINCNIRVFFNCIDKHSDMPLKR